MESQFSQVEMQASYSQIDHLPFLWLAFLITMRRILQVQLAQKQFEDMCEHRNALYHSTEMANDSKVKKIEEPLLLVLYIAASNRRQSFEARI